MNKSNNILKHKTLSRLPRGCFFSGDCPGAAAITIFCSLFSSLWGTLGRRTEVGSRKTEVGRQLVPHFLFPNFLNADRSKDAVRFAYDATPLDLSACTAPDNVGQIKKGKENNEHRIMNNEYRIRKSEVRSQKSEVGSPKREPGFDNLLNHCSNFLAPLSPLAKGDEIRPLVAGSEGVVTPTNVGKENNEHRISNNESGSFSGIPVPYFLFPEKGKRPETTPGRVEIAPGIRKMTQGRVEIAPEFKKMTQGRVKTTPELKKMTHGRVKIASGRVEYAPGPLPARHSLIFRCAPTAPGYRVGTPEKPEMGLIKGENKEHRISNNEYRIRKAENACLPDRQGIRNLTGNGISTSFLSPSPFGEGRGEANNESGSPKSEVGSPKWESGFDNLLNHCSNLPAPLSPFMKGDEFRPLVAGTEGVGIDFNAVRSGDADRFNIVASSADLSVPIAIGIRPDNVGQTGKENNEYRIRKAENACLPDRQGIRNLTCNGISTKFQKSAPSPPLWGGREGLSPHLPRGGFYSGDCPGAAAITIFISIFSSSRLSPNFAGVMRLAVPNRLAPLTILPVANQQALHRSSFVPLVKGDKSRFIGTGGHEDKIPENQEVSTTSPKIRMKGFLKERRYAVT
jgi:hypothetical protein